MTRPEQAQSEATRAAARLREQIIDGERPPGSRLVERDLAAELGVSRVPIREAIRLLTAEGLATPRPRTWAIVRTFTDRDVQELEELRTSLEILAFTRAARRHEAGELQRLQDIVARGQAAAEAADALAARRAATEFHSGVVSLSGNSHLQELWGTIESRVRWMLSQHDDLFLVAEEHRRLCAALATRDEVLVAELVEEHAQTSRALHKGRRG